MKRSEVIDEIIYVNSRYYGVHWNEYDFSKWLKKILNKLSDLDLVREAKAVGLDVRLEDVK